MGSDPAPSPSLTAPGRLFAHSLARGSSQSGLYSANQTRWTSSGSGPGCHPRLPPHALRDASSPWLLGPLRSPRLQFVGAPLSPRPHVQAPMAGAAAGSRGRPQRVNMQEHMAIDVSPGPIRPIRLISDYFPHFYPFAKRALSAPDPHPAVIPAIRSAPRQRAAPEPEGDSDDSTALGALEFTLLFDADNSALHCTAHRAKGLKPPASGSVDTYVKANLLPGASKASQLRTRTVRGTRGPVWEETLTYHGFTRQDAGRKTLWLCVCEDPRLRRRRGAPPLGELRVPLRKLVPNRARSFDVCLEKRKLIKRPKSLDTARGMSLYEEEETEAAGDERGRILLSLCYSSRQGGLLVGVLRCAHLAPMDANGYSDPFVRLFLHPNVGKRRKYKTSVRKKTLNPEFNEEFFYAGPREELAQKTLLVSVWDYDLGTADDFIGGVQLSSHASGERQRHWCECLGRSDCRLELWHPLDGAPPQLSD
ncbi:double C2-like domain-containing protein gamma isoform X1 [Panthera pardus]|uniref:Double C2-like domain-containing protein gamma isoform X1 n=2 Tax=Panthera pardus TaxID=9691 RepID=A0A9W2V9P3_PANPR|nr:double C2-like domain-containing protein gamma isoform X1 [Panthera pardus]